MITIMKILLAHEKTLQRAWIRLHVNKQSFALSITFTDQSYFLVAIQSAQNTKLYRNI